ncbi:MAG: hypothetical protein ABIA75_06565 [Candidatus Neomarinimicrobiota bacterium]
MKRRGILIIPVLIGCILAAQNPAGRADTRQDQGQQMGVELISCDRAFEELVIRTVFTGVSYDYPLTTGALLNLALGINQLTIPSQTSGISDLKGKPAMYGRAEISHRFWLFYGRAAALIYWTKGEVNDGRDGVDTYRYHNQYTFYEYPAEAGLRLTVGPLDFNAGLLKTFLYGTNTKQLKLEHAGGVTDLGQREYSFIDRLPVCPTAGLTWSISAKYNLRINCDYYSLTRYQLGIAFWSSVAQSARL